MGGRPIHQVLELLGRRWCLRLIWELHHRSPIGPRALAQRSGGVSTSVLYQRLYELTEAGIVAQNDDDAYGLTAIGEELGATLEELGPWTVRWLRQSGR
ncbi:MAG: winged helix-turn-helix transcriptional regulator [Microthrixaceae bacterium]